MVDRLQLQKCIEEKDSIIKEKDITIISLQSRIEYLESAIEDSIAASSHILSISTFE
jgi:hypothetical protein